MKVGILSILLNWHCRYNICNFHDLFLHHIVKLLTLMLCAILMKIYSQL